MDALCIGAFVGRENIVTQTVRGPQPGVPGGAAPLGWQTGSPAGVLDSLRTTRTEPAYPPLAN
jgi:hypothetical protein